MASESSLLVSRVLSISVGNRKMSLDADKVTEVIRRPAITRVPNGPAALVGLCNLRGLPLPIVDMRSLLGFSPAPGFPGDRVVVYSQSEPVGLLVDEVSSLLEGSAVDTIPDLAKHLSAIFSSAKPERKKQASNKLDADHQELNSEVFGSFLAFSVGGQTFGMSLWVVEQVIALPTEQNHYNDSKTRLTTFRGRVIPLVCVAELVGVSFSERKHSERKIVVIEHDEGTVGLIVDQIEAILRLPASAIDPVPPLLRRSRGSAELDGVGRYNNGRSLVGILSPQKLFHHAMVETALSGKASRAPMQEISSMAGQVHEKFLLFGLGEETYGLPLGAIEEVIRLPEVVTRVPNAPAFVLGVTNLRGKALPLIDQRARFGTSSGSTRPRAIVLTAGGLQAGFAVDTVSEVVRVPISDVTASPGFSSEGTAVFDRVAHIKVDGRMILVVDPRQLLSGSERDLVSTMATRQNPSEAS